MNGESFTEPTILYVDDQPSHLALFKKAFQGDYLVLTASDVEEGIEILKEHDIFLVIADHNMPRMTGIDFLQKAREVSPKAVPALLSAYLNDEIVKEAEALKIAGHLQKPWKLDRMREFIEESYKRYEIGIPVGEESKQELPPPERGWISPQQISQFVERLEEKVDSRGARRIFLKFVEPSLKEFVPLIRRPAPMLLAQAQAEALKGNHDLFQKILVNYLRQESLIENPIEKSAIPLKNIH